MQEVVEVLGSCSRGDSQESEGFAILADETTDKAVLEQLILYVRYLLGKGTMEC